MKKILIVSALSLAAIPMFGQVRPDTDAEGYYLIANAENLKWFRDEVNRSVDIDPEYAKDSFVISRLNARLTADIDLSGTGDWTPIAAYNEGKKNLEYAGVFDGQGHVISGMAVKPEQGRISYGLFGYVWRGTVKNLGIVSSTVDIPSGDYYTGAFCGMLGQDAVIENCFTTATVTSGGSVGGLSGGIRKTGVIRNCYNAGNVTLLAGGGGNGGGICGYIGNDASVEGCYNLGQVKGGDGGSRIGAITGYVSKGNMGECYYLDAMGYVPSQSALDASALTAKMNAALFDHEPWQGEARVEADEIVLPSFDASKPVVVSLAGEPTAIVGVAAAVVPDVAAGEGNIFVRLFEKAEVAISAASGVNVYSACLAEGSHRISGLRPGMYVVGVGQKVFKVVVR